MLDYFYNFAHLPFGKGIFSFDNEDGTALPPISQSRITQDGQIRIIENGQTRITEE